MRQPCPVILLVALVASGCAGMRGPIGDGGPIVTIHNEGDRLLDLSYTCVQNGPVQRLGAITPRASESFALWPSSCSTLYLIDQPRGVTRADQPAFAVVPMFGESLVELVFTQTGLMMRKKGR